MQIFQLAAAWLLPFAVCATMALDASAAVDHEHEHSSSPRPSSVGGQAPSAGSSPSTSSTSSSTCSLGDRVGFQTTSLQRSRSASPRCFGARGSKQKEAASRAATPKGDVVSALQAAQDLKGHRRQRKIRPAVNASVSCSSSPASTISSSIEDRLGFRTPHQLPCFGSKLPRGSSSPGKGSGVGSYLREITRRLRRGNAEKSAPPLTWIGRTVRERSRGNAIAWEEELKCGRLSL